MTRPPPYSTLFPYTTLFRSRELEEILGGQKDGVIDIGRTAGTESADLIGDGSLVFGEGHAELGVGGKGDRKSTRLNSSHPSISYAVFCLKKKKNKTKQ